MSLSEQTQELMNNFINGLDEHDKAAVMSGFEAIRNTPYGVNALRVGDQAKDFRLPNASGGPQTLAVLLKEGPLVISFYRGGWCPYCNLEFKALSDALPKINQLGAKLIGISPELPDNSMSTKEKHQLPFDVLSDVGNKVAREYGIVMDVPPSMIPLYIKWGLDVPKTNGDESWELPIPATYVIDKDGKVSFAFVNKNYTERCEPAEIIKALQSLAEAA
jgi:peroxiredoxin